MAPPRQNKYAVGLGRPHATEWDDDKLIDLGEELMEWIEEVEAMPEKEKNYIVHLSDFYSSKKRITRSEWKIIVQRLCFLPYYEHAMDWMSRKTMRNKDLPQSYGNRFLGMYARDMYEHEKSVREEETLLKLKCKQDDQNDLIEKLREEANKSKNPVKDG